MSSRTVRLTDPQIHALITALAERDVALEDREGDQNGEYSRAATRERQVLERARCALSAALPEAGAR